MTKAFLFDMDGVLGDTEAEWDRLGYDQFIIDYFGQDMASKVDILSGMGFESIFLEFVKLGWKGDYDTFHQANIKFGKSIYSKVELTPNLEKLINTLKKEGFLIGIVSSSPEVFIDSLVSRIPNKNKIDIIISVNNHDSLKPKPAPDPYLHAMKVLKVKPSSTIVLEDSRAGVTSAVAAGATTICFTGHYHPEFSWQIKPDNANYYAASLEEVEKLVSSIKLS